MAEWWSWVMPSSFCSQVGRLTSRWWLLGSFGAASCSLTLWVGLVLGELWYPFPTTWTPSIALYVKWPYFQAAVVSLLVSFLPWFPPSSSHAIVILTGLRKTKCNRVSKEVFWLLYFFFSLFFFFSFFSFFFSFFFFFLIALKRGSLVLEEMRQTGRVGKSRVKSIFNLLLRRCFHLS